MSKLALMIMSILFGFSILSTPASSQTTGKDFSEQQKQAINQMIRDYILEHPEILPEAINILQNRTKLNVLEQNHVRLYDDGFSYVGGNINGDITLVEFFDYNCGYCKKALITVEKLIKEDSNLRIIYKEFPILSETSFIAAKAAMASIKQGKYESFHHALLSNSGALTEERIYEIARSVGLDEKQLIQDMISPVLERNIQINNSIANALGINGTPGFVIGNEIVPGAIPYEELVRLIKKARRQQAVKKGN